MMSFNKKHIKTALECRSAWFHQVGKLKGALLGPFQIETCSETSALILIKSSQ